MNAEVIDLAVPSQIVDHVMAYRPDVNFGVLLDIGDGVRIVGAVFLSLLVSVI